MEQNIGKIGLSNDIRARKSKKYKRGVKYEEKLGQGQKINLIRSRDIRTFFPCR